MIFQRLIGVRNKKCISASVRISRTNEDNFFFQLNDDDCENFNRNINKSGFVRKGSKKS